MVVGLLLVVVTLAVALVVTIIVALPHGFVALLIAPDADVVPSSISHCVSSDFP